jgi:hypothetical protein
VARLREQQSKLVLERCQDFSFQERKLLSDNELERFKKISLTFHDATFKLVAG